MNALRRTHGVISERERQAIYQECYMEITTFAKLTMLEVAVDNSGYTDEEKQALYSFLADIARIMAEREK